MQHSHESDVPGPLELRCLQVVWRLGKANVKDVRDAIAKDRKLAYTTVMTTLDRLEKKGTLRRQKSGKAFIYEAATPESEIRELAVRHLVDEYFEGSREKLAEFLRHSNSSAAAAAGAAKPERPEQAAIDAVLL